MHHEVTFSCVLKLKFLPHTDKIFPLVILQLKVLGAWEIWIFKRNRRVPVKIGLIPNNDTLSQRKKIIILIVVISPFKYSAFAWKKKVCDLFGITKPGLAVLSVMILGLIFSDNCKETQSDWTYSTKSWIYIILLFVATHCWTSFSSYSFQMGAVSGSCS